MKNETKWKNREYSMRIKKHWAKGEAKEFRTRMLRLIKQFNKQD